MTHPILDRAAAGHRISDEEALWLAEYDDTGSLMAIAAALRNAEFGENISYSRKVFIPLTKLCRDVCHYCTFAHVPRRGERSFLTVEECVAIAEAGVREGCVEALFTLGDKPEMRYRAAQEELAALGHRTTLSYLEEAAAAVFQRTGLLPHLNPGLMGAEDYARLRPFSASMGLMLESASERLMEPGKPHFGSPDKHPAARLDSIRLAGEAGVPFTSGLLIGIGETRRERIEALLALRSLHERYGHIQEIIIQNFRAKAGTRMAEAPEPSIEDHLWTIAAARIVLGQRMAIQAPPNLSKGSLARLVDAGINDWGGVSPVTPDHVNPEASWPHLAVLERATNAAGKHLVQRLPVYPSYLRDAQRWLDKSVAAAAISLVDSEGFVRPDAWSPGRQMPVPETESQLSAPNSGQALLSLLDKAVVHALDEEEIVTLFTARGRDFQAVCRAADELRASVCGDTVSYVVTRNVNYTNVCTYKCQFCAFSKGRGSENLRGAPYDLSIEEIQRRVREGWARGASEVCMQGGIHPDYTGATYLEICRAVKAATPGIHVHAFSPLEIRQGAATLGLSVADFLSALKEAGLGTLPGTAAEILDDEVRATLCADKLNTQEWLDVMETAHRLGIHSTSTIMFGHLEQPRHWARHLLRLRRLQERTGGFTEFVPLPFVHMEAPVYLKGRARRGPTFRESILMHAVGRLVLNGLIDNIQTSWVKMGRDGAIAALAAGANDLGGTLMNETISRAAGASHGQEMSPEIMEDLIYAAGRRPMQRTTLYSTAPPERRTASFAAAPLAGVVNTPLRRKERALAAG